MSRTIKRGPPPRRPAVRRKTVRKASLGDRILAKLPVSQEVLRRAVTWTILAGVAIVGVAAASWLGLFASAGTALADTAGRAGLRVQQIEVTGLKRMDRMSVYAVALDQQSQAMPLVDLEAVRQKLLRYGWVEDAHVSRRLPDTLLIDIVERQPAAVWQDNGQLTLIDSKGVLLEPVDPSAIPKLPLMIGPGADLQEAGYTQLLAAAPGLKPRIRAATWVGDRRWDLLFDTGETLALPEEGATKALMTFARLNDDRPLLGHGWIRFDMRDPTKLVARKPNADLAHQLDDTGASVAPGGTVAAGAADAGKEG